MSKLMEDDSAFVPPLKLAVLWQVPQPGFAAPSGIPLVDLDFRMQEVRTVTELKELEAQVTRAQNPSNEAWAALQKKEHPVRFALPVDRQLILHLLEHSGLLTRKPDPIDDAIESALQGGVDALERAGR